MSRGIVPNAGSAGDRNRDRPIAERATGLKGRHVSFANTKPDGRVTPNDRSKSQTARAAAGTGALWGKSAARRHRVALHAGSR